jgi:hypothetical protein
MRTRLFAGRGGRRIGALAVACALSLGAPACGGGPPATEGRGHLAAPADENSPGRKADTPAKLVRCLKRQRVKAKPPSTQTSGDIALSNAGIPHETVVIGGTTDVVAYFLDDRGQVRGAKQALGLNDTVASSGSVVVAYLKAENRSSRGPAIEACL